MYRNKKQYCVRCLFECHARNKIEDLLLLRSDTISRMLQE